jgi:hypothetical protein
MSRVLGNFARTLKNVALLTRCSRGVSRVVAPSVVGQEIGRGVVRGRQCRDVRLLVPSASDIPVLRAVSRAGYRPLLEAGVRVFEWNGPMLHAKRAAMSNRRALGPAEAKVLGSSGALLLALARRSTRIERTHTYSARSRQPEGSREP